MHAMIVTVREAYKQYAASARSYDSNETIAYVRAVRTISDLQNQMAEQALSAQITASCNTELNGCTTVAQRLHC
jgi:hypothetical protein